MNLMNSDVLGWSIFILLFCIILFFYAQRARLLVRMQISEQVLPMHKLVISGVLVMTSAFGFTIHPAPFWVHCMRVAALYYGLLLSYSANRWLLTGTPHMLTRSKSLFVTSLCMAAIIITGYISHDNLVLILTNESFERTTLYYLHYGLVASGLLVLYMCITWVIWKSILMSSDLTYIVRRFIMLLSFVLAACCAALVSINLALSVSYGDMYRSFINQIFFCMLPVIGVMPAINVVPDRWIVKLTRPLAQHRDLRQQGEQELLSYLHSKMVQIVPRVQLHNAELRHLRLDIEIGDARELMWSHVDRTISITPKDEAEYIHSLLDAQQVITTPGKHTPPSIRHMNIRKHNLAVAKYLKRRTSRVSPTIRRNCDTQTDA
jgi:hypothetical protein